MGFAQRPLWATVYYRLKIIPRDLCLQRSGRLKPALRFTAILDAVKADALMSLLEIIGTSWYPLIGKLELVGIKEVDDGDKNERKRPGDYPDGY